MGSQRVRHDWAINSTTTNHLIKLSCCCYKMNISTTKGSSVEMRVREEQEVFKPISDVSIHGISQTRILKWVTITISKGSSRSRDQTCISSTGRQVLYHWATREVLPKDILFFLRHHRGQTGSRHPGGAEFPEGSYSSSYCQEIQPQASLGPGWVSQQGPGSHVQSLGSFRTEASNLWCWRRLLRVPWTV